MASQTMRRSVSGGRRPARPATRAGDGIRRDYLYYGCAGLFFLTLFLSIALVKYGVGGLPLRAVTAIAILGLIGLTSPGILTRAVHDIRTLLGIIFASAMLGILASLLNGMAAADLGRQVLEIHVQAAVSVVVGACLIRVCGPTTMFRVIALVMALTTVVALLQFLNFAPAWNLRDMLQRMQPLEIDADSVFLKFRLRAMGLSFSPVHLGTQLSLLFAAGIATLAHRDGRRILERFDMRVMLLAFVVLFGSIISGNRSPLMGVIAFFIAYLFFIRPAIAVILSVTLLPFVVFLDDIMLVLADMGLRVARTNDSSSAGRAVLRVYGLLLLLDRPYGYGLIFNSASYWQTYWDQLKDYENPMSITVNALHNYYILVLDKYGILMLGLGAYSAFLIRNNIFAILGFIPYAVHIFYHNDGPLQADFIIWFIMPLFRHLPSRTTSTRMTGRRSGRRPVRTMPSDDDISTGRAALPG